MTMQRQRGFSAARSSNPRGGGGGRGLRLGRWDAQALGMEALHTCHQIAPDLLLLSRLPASGARDLKGAAWEPSVLRLGGSCPQPPEGAKRTAGAHGRGPPRVTAGSGRATRPAPPHPHPAGGPSTAPDPRQALARGCRIRRDRHLHPAPYGEAVSPEPLGPPGSGTPAHLCLRMARAGLAQGLQKEQPTAPGPAATQGPGLGGHTTESAAGLPWPQVRAERGQCHVTSRPEK